MKKIMFLVFALTLLTGCANFRETHYFKTVNAKTGQIGNYFRLNLKGDAYFSATRYMAGYYDERAVDIFFNELKITSGTCTANTIKVFPDDLKLPGTGEAIQPYKAEQEGTFVMIMSTNAEAMSNAIGSFAESRVVAEAITNIANKDTIVAARRAEIDLSVKRGEATALTAELGDLLSRLDALEKPAQKETIRIYLHILNRIAQALNHPQQFTTLAEGEAWLRVIRPMLEGN